MLRCSYFPRCKSFNIRSSFVRAWDGELDGRCEWRASPEYRKGRHDAGCYFGVAFHASVFVSFWHASFEPAPRRRCGWSTWLEQTMVHLQTEFLHQTSCCVANAFLTRSVRMSPNQGHNVCSIVAWTCARHLRQLIEQHFEANRRWSPSSSLEMRTSGFLHITHGVLHLRVVNPLKPLSPACC
jgi:hypothetical protein